MDGAEGASVQGRRLDETREPPSGAPLFGAKRADVREVAGALRSVFELDGLSIAVVAFWVGALAALLPGMVVQDTWLSFVDGRLIVRHWLPHIDTLTWWTLGRSWVDQQWGAHVVLYELVRLGGIRAALGLGVACVACALVIAAVAARRLGASPERTAVVLLLPVLAAGWLMQLRSQSLALPLFMCVYALLALDDRRPGRRVLWVLPLLVLWANVHGSVALGAGLVLMHGIGLSRRRSVRTRGLVLVACSPLTLVATPYGFRLVAYYRLMLLHPPLASFVTEWKPAAVSVMTAVFFVSAFGLCALLGAHRHILTKFETCALPLLLIAALVAVRNAIWFELAAAVALPRLIDIARPRQVDRTIRVARRNSLFGAAALSVVAVFVAIEFIRVPSLIESHTPPTAAAIVARAAGASGIVLADENHADWLLWQQPSLTGRIAYDVRFELFTKPELEQLKLLLAGSHPVWQRCGEQARVVTFDGPSDEQAAIRERVLSRNSKTIVNSPDFIAVLQPDAVRGPCRL